MKLSMDVERRIYELELLVDKESPGFFNRNHNQFNMTIRQRHLLAAIEKLKTGEVKIKPDDFKCPGVNC